MSRDRSTSVSTFCFANSVKIPPGRAAPTLIYMQKIAKRADTTLGLLAQYLAQESLVAIEVNRLDPDHLPQ